MNLKEVHPELTPYLIDENAREPKSLARVYTEDEATSFEVQTLRNSVTVNTLN